MDVGERLATVIAGGGINAMFGVPGGQTMPLYGAATGAALTQLGVQRERPSLYDLEDQLKALTVPTLIVTGDEDEPCLAPGIYMKRKIPSAGLAVLAKTGHTLNLEEPAAFNRLLTEFFDSVEAGRWEPRDPRSISQKADHVSISSMYFSAMNTS